MPLRFAGVTACITILLLLGVLKAEAGEILDLVPESIESTVSLGMSGAELAVSRPGARIVARDKRYEVSIELLQEDGLWDSVMYGIRGGRITAISLTRGGVKQAGTAEIVGDALRLAIAEYGDQFARRAERSTYNVKPFLSPILVWRKAEYNVFFSFVPTRKVAEGEKAGIRLTLAERDVPINELFELPDPATETRFIENDFSDILSVRGVESVRGSSPGARVDVAEKKRDEEPLAASKTPNEHSDSVYLIVGVGMAVLICFAVASFLLRRVPGDSRFGTDSGNSH